jgi:hypothetical protein
MREEIMEPERDPRFGVIQEESFFNTVQCSI